MALIDTNHVSPRDRAEAIRQVIWDTVVRVEIAHHPTPSRIRAIGSITALGPLTICSVRSNATTIKRTPTLSRDDLEPSLFLGLQVSGTSMVVQKGREVVLRPGDMALYDTTVPYTLLNDEGIHQHFFRIPRAALALPSDTLGQAAALRFGAEEPLTDLTSTYFRRLATGPLRSSEPAARSAMTVVRPSIELLRALITTRLDARAALQPLHETLELRIREYVRAHLSEADLTAARIAAAHHISVRHLYAVLERAGIALGEWIRTERLEECRRELSRPGAEYKLIAAIAHRWGFSNHTHFSRVFKEAYGMSAREWRDLQRRD
jgi:AraC-like DNA-binding protein